MSGIIPHTMENISMTPGNIPTQRGTDQGCLGLSPTQRGIDHGCLGSSPHNGEHIKDVWDHPPHNGEHINDSWEHPHIMGNTLMMVEMICTKVVWKDLSYYCLEHLSDSEDVMHIQQSK